MNPDDSHILPTGFGEKQEIFRNRFVHLYSVKAYFRDFEREYFITDKGKRVGVMVWRNDDILLVRQYRFLIDGLSWELPGGGINEGETPEEAAMRECSEEAGVDCQSVQSVFRYEQGIDTTLSPAHIFETYDYDEGDGVIENLETDKRKWEPFSECLRMVLAGEIQDSMTITAVLAKSAQMSLGDGSG
ncbi:MAG: NUDIX hydrolase [Chloroflexi bacterium]|nr:NUDIX hydrolase [Chloroflexota bacterium]